MEPEEERMNRWIVVAASGALLACGAPQETPGGAEGAASTGASAEGAAQAAAAVGSGGQAAALAPAAVPGDFADLLKQADGSYQKTGWNHYGPGYFDLDRETGVLTSHGGMGLLWYSVHTYSDFVLEIEFRCTDAETNSGVFVRVPAVPTSDDYIYHSFEVQINDAGEGIHSTAAAYDAEAPTKKASKPPGEWNQYRITFQGNRLQVELNGELVLDWQAEPRGKVADFAEAGYVGLQNHDDRSPVYFRNVRIRALR
jgi:hypothetical protein